MEIVKKADYIFATLRSIGLRSVYFVEWDKVPVFTKFMINSIFGFKSICPITVSFKNNIVFSVYI